MCPFHLVTLLIALYFSSLLNSITASLLPMNIAAWKCTNIFLVRHGESYNNCLYELVRSRFGDTLSHEEFEIELEKLHESDCGLSDRGHSQAGCLKEYLASKKEFPSNRKPGDYSTAKFKILSSPMKRCLLTAQAVSQGLGGLPVTVHPRFYESDGCFKGGPGGSTIGLPGMTKHQVEGMFAGFTCLEGMEEGWYKGAVKETADEFLARAQEIVEFIWHLHEDASGDDDSSIVLVAHGNVIREVLTRLINTTGLVTHCNTGFSHIQLWSSSTELPHRMASIQYVNRVDHLVNDPHLIAGNDIFDDHWIQEYIYQMPK